MAKSTGETKAEAIYKFGAFLFGLVLIVFIGLGIFEKLSAWPALIGMIVSAVLGIVCLGTWASLRDKRRWEQIQQRFPQKEE